MAAFYEKDFDFALCIQLHRVTPIPRIWNP